MNTIILITAIILLSLSLTLLRKHEKKPLYKWLSILLFFVSIPFFVMLYGALGGFFIAVAAMLLSGIFMALCFGKHEYTK